MPESPLPLEGQGEASIYYANYLRSKESEEPQRNRGY